MSLADVGLCLGIVWGKNIVLLLLVIMTVLLF